MTDQKTPSLEQAKAYIDAIDFSMIADKMVKTKGRKKRHVLQICTLYRHFLFLKKKYGMDDVKLPPSEEIDEFWHNHILDTKKYRIDFEQIFGFYLDHYPYLGIDGKTTWDDLRKFFETTQELHSQEFGSYIPDVRFSLFKRLKRFFNILISK